MDINNILEKSQLTDLEINTSDGQKLYVTRIWLIHITPYFKSLLAGNFSETNSTSITLSYPSKIIITLLKCIYEGYLGDTHIKKELDQNLTTHDDIRNFLSACTEYMLDHIKNLSDELFSENEYVGAPHAHNLIVISQKFGINKTKKNLQKMIEKLDYLSYDAVECSTLNFFMEISWHHFIESLRLWLIYNDPTDDELVRSGLYKYDYKKCPEKLVDSMTRIVRQFIDAPAFKLKVLEELSYVVYPEQDLLKDSLENITDPKILLYINKWFVKNTNPNIEFVTCDSQKFAITITYLNKIHLVQINYPEDYPKKTVGFSIKEVSSFGFNFTNLNTQMKNKSTSIDLLLTYIAKIFNNVKNTEKKMESSNN